MLALLAAAPAYGQGPGVEVGYFFGDTGRSDVRLGFTHQFAGPLGGGLYGSWMHGPDPLGDLWGLGADLSLFRSGRRGLFLVGGVSGGFAVNAPASFWGSWSAGVGYEFFPLNGLSVSAEGRWREFSVRPNHGLEVSLRIGLDRASRRHAEPGSAGNPPASAVAGAPDSATVVAEAERMGSSAWDAGIVAAVVRTATEAMGTPYQWGGTGNGAGGFDCSGLIQFAYGKHGIELPRTSQQQAEWGGPVERRLESLRPGDILTFSNQSDQVTHVGLYVGGGKFIHSASQGVQLSLLSSDDPYGRWWWERWVGARRIVR